PAEASSAGLEALEGEETHSEILMTLNEPSVPSVPSLPTRDEPAKKKKTPWILFLSAAIALLAVGAWLTTRHGEPSLDTRDAVRTQMTVPRTPAEDPAPVPIAAPSAAAEEPQEAEEAEAAEVPQAEAHDPVLADGNVEADPAENTLDEEAPVIPSPRANRRARAAAVRAREAASPEAPAEPARPATMMTSPAWEPTGSSDNVDPWN
ncbi:MAG: hypothetical protein ACI9KE_000638, partial [Polyangiales bacterium]